MAFFYVTDLKSNTTFLLEPARKGAKKLHAYAMTARLPANATTGEKLDWRVSCASVPLYIRRAARDHLGGSCGGSP